MRAGADSIGPTSVSHCMKYKKTEIFLSIFFLFLGTLLFASDSLAEVRSQYGADFRLRYEYWENIFDFDTLGVKNENFYRLKTSPWANWDFSRNFSAYLKISNEAKYYKSSFSADNDSLEEDEIVFENLFFEIRNAAGLPADLKIGRQDIKYGDGFLIWDGTPGSADKMKYFNAVKASWRLEKNHSIDFVYLYAPMTDTLLPSVHPAKSGRAYQDHKRILNTSDSKGFAVYSRNNIGESLILEPYYIYKQEEQISRDIPQLDLNTIGARAVYKVDSWKLKGELARQFGEYRNKADRRGNGGNIFISRMLEKTLWKPELEAGYLYLSGDDPDTRTNEGWDPIFSRWPGLSRLYIYAFFRETGIIAYWTNLELYRADVKLNFTPNTNLALYYNYLRADEKTRITGASASMFSNDGKERGQLGQAALNHKFAKNIDGLLMFEYFMPGNFYSRKADDALFFRCELQIKL